jgi:hypothetical protein
MEDIKFLGWIMAVIGLVIRYMISRRRFYRRGIGGLQHFSSYEKGLFVTFVEKIFGLLAYLLLLGAVLALGFFYSNKWFEKNMNKDEKGTSELVLSVPFTDLRPLPHFSEKAAGKSRLSSHLPETGIVTVFIRGFRQEALRKPKNPHILATYETCPYTNCGI